MHVTLYYTYICPITDNHSDIVCRLVFVAQYCSCGDLTSEEKIGHNT